MEKLSIFLWNPKNHSGIDLQDPFWVKQSIQIISFDYILIVFKGKNFKVN